MRRDDHAYIGNARCGEFFDDKIECGAVYQREELLGDLFGNGEEAAPVPGCEDKTFYHGIWYRISGGTG